MSADSVDLSWNSIASRDLLFSDATGSLTTKRRCELVYRGIQDAQRNQVDFGKICEIGISLLQAYASISELKCLDDMYSEYGRAAD